LFRRQHGVQVDAGERTACHADVDNKRNGKLVHVQSIVTSAKNVAWSTAHGRERE